MKVILLKTVPKLGNSGEIKEVSEGYARNFLLPRGEAGIATKNILSQMEARKKKAVRLAEKSKKQKEKILGKIGRKNISIEREADEKGTLYAGLGKDGLSRELKSLGHEISPEEIRIKGALKKTGRKKIELNINGKKAIITLEIKPKKQ